MSEKVLTHQEGRGSRLHPGDSEAIGKDGSWKGAEWDDGVCS